MDPGSPEPTPDPSSEPDEVDILLSRIESHGLTPSQAMASVTPRSQGLWEPPTPEELEKQIPPQYKVLDLAGRGGMGAVYRGWQSSLERYVAIKILPPDATSDDANFRDRFRQEAKTMAKFQHPAIVSIYDAGATASGLLYIVMEFVEGTDVSLMVRSQGKLPPEYALAISAHVCDALHYAHTHGVIHRDIKPANVMINQEGAVKVADFGLARGVEFNQGGGFTKSNLAVGTPDYVAPEALIPGIKTDARADLYAVGVMLYEMLTGKVPRGMFEMPSVVTKGAIDERFDAIVAKAMDPDREKRYQTALEIRYDLDVILNTPKLEAHGPSSSAIPKQELALVQRQMIARKPVARRPGMTQPVHEVVTYEPVKEKKSKRPALLAVAALAVGGYFGWQKFAAHGPPTAAAAEAGSSASPVQQPAGTLIFGGHRYLFVNEQLAWEKAKIRAEAMRGHLATLTTKEERQWAHEQLLHQRGLRTAHVMIGGSQARRGAPWVWVTGEPFDMSLWGTRGPDGSGPYLTMMLEGNSVVWDDVSARDSDCFLVEWDDLTTPIPAETLPKAALASAWPAPPDSIPFNGHRYKFVRGEMTWNEANDQAGALGGHLVTLTTKKEDDWVRTTFVNLLPAAHLLFIGGLKAPGGDSPFRWSNGELWSYTNWEKGTEPKGIPNPVGVVYLNYPLGAGKWSASWNPTFKVILHEGRNRIEGFLVEWDTDPVESPKIASKPAPADALPFGGHRYKFFMDDESWITAKVKAEKMGGHLATLTTKEEDDWVRKTFVTSSTVPPGRLFHIGGVRAKDSNQWTWVTGEPWSFQNPKFSPKPETANTFGLQYWGTKGGEWVAAWDVSYRIYFNDGPDKGQSRIQGFLVEWDTDAVESPVAAAGAQSFGGHRYLLVYADLSWREANDQAIAMGGHLAALTTQEENDWVRQTFVENLPKEQLFYIGGIKHVGEGAPWRWITGEPWSFENWDGNRKPDPSVEARGAGFMNFERGGPHWVAKWESSKKLGRSVGFLVEWDTDRVASPAAPALAGEAASIAPINLLATVDAARDALVGRWEMKPDGLTTTQEKGGKAQVLEFNKTAPDEYDFEIEFTITGGSREITQILPLPTHLIVWKMGPKKEDPTCFGFGPYLDGRLIDSATPGEINAALPRLKIGQRYRCMIEVRKGSLRAVLDGKEVVKWSGDLARLSLGSQSSVWAGNMKSPRHPAVATYTSDAVFHRAELRPKGVISKRLADLEAQFKDAYERDVIRGSAKAFAVLDNQYLAAVEAALAKAQKDGRPDDVTALQAEKHRINDQRPLPAADPVNIIARLGELRSTYRKAQAPLIKQRDVAAEPVYARYDQALAALQAELTLKGDNSGARSIQDLREDLEKQRHPLAVEPAIAAVAPAPSTTPAPNANLAMAPSKPVEPKPKNDSKPRKEAAPATLPPDALQEPAPKPFTPTQAIEWALSLGGSAKIKKGSAESEILSLGKAPKSSVILTSLKIGGGQPMHVVSLAALSQLADLRELILDDNLITDAGLAFLPKLPKLTHLSLRGCNLTDAGLSHLAKQQALTSLNLRGNFINGSGFGELRGLQGMTALDLGDCQLSDENISTLTAFTALASLNLAGRGPLAANNLSPLANLKGLKQLTLGGSATDAVMQSVSNLTQLSALELYYAPISDAALERIGSMKGLRDLNLFSCRNLTDFGFAKLQALKGLTKLNIEHTRLTDSQFIELSTKLLEITELNVASDAMTDQGLAGLVNLRKLTSLDLHARMCTDVGIGYVKRLAALRNLGIVQRETLSPARFEALKRALPNFPWRM